MSVKSKQSAV